jgi:hypothetical protein
MRYADEVKENNANRDKLHKTIIDMVTAMQPELQALPPGYVKWSDVTFFAKMFSMVFDRDLFSLDLPSRMLVPSVLVVGDELYNQYMAYRKVAGALELKARDLTYRLYNEARGARTYKKLIEAWPDHKELIIEGAQNAGLMAKEPAAAPVARIIKEHEEAQTKQLTAPTKGPITAQSDDGEDIEVITV